MDLEKVVNIVAGGAVEALKKKVKLYGGIAIGCIAGGIIIICSIFGGVAMGGNEANGFYNPSTATSGTQWDNFKRFVLANEGGTKTSDGKYYIVEDDSAGNPTVGHGLCLYSTSDMMYLHKEAFANYGINSVMLANNWINGDRSGKVPVEICDEIWEDNLRSIYESVVNTYSNLPLTQYQCFALTDVKYRRGNTGGFENAYNTKWSSSDNRYKQNIGIEEYSLDSLYSFFQRWIYKYK